MNGIISAIPNNWKEIIMGEIMIHDLICNEIAEKAKEENKPSKYVSNYLFREFDNSLVGAVQNEKTI